MSMREKGGAFLFYMLYGVLAGILLTGCGAKEEAKPEATNSGSIPAVSASADIGAGAASSAAVSSSPGQPSDEDGTELWFRVDQMDFVNDKTGWVAGEDESGPFLGLTSNGGADWSKVDTGRMYITALAPLERDRGFAVGSSDCQEQKGIFGCQAKGIYETSDGGAHWTPRWETQTSREDVSPYTADVLSVSPKGWGYAVADHQLLLTRDGGVSWNAAAFTGKLEGFVPEKADFTGPWQGWAAGYTVAPGCAQGVEPVQAEAGCRIPAVAYTDNGGSGWQLGELPEAERGQTVIGISAPDEHTAFVLLFNPANLVASFYSWAVEEPGNWRLTSTFRGGRPYASDLQLVTADKGFVGLRPGAGPIEGGLMVTRDSGKNWENAPIEDIVGVSRISFPDERLGWLLAEANRERSTLLRTRDGGESWERVSLPAEIFGR